MGQRCDDDVAIFFAPDRPLLDGALAGLVDFADVVARGDDLGVGRVVRPLHMGHQGIQAGVRVVQELHAGVGYFPRVVRRDVGRHAHGDAGHPVEQDVRQAGGQHHRLFHGAIEVRRPLHRALPQLGEQQLGEARQARLGITHGGEGFGIVRRAPVALTVHQRVAVGERLGHQHHGFVTGAVAVGMVLTEYVTHGTGRLLVLGEGGEPQLAHGIDDAPLHGLEAVADMGQGPVHDDVHGVVQVSLLGKGAHGLALYPVQTEL